MTIKPRILIPALIALVAGGGLLAWRMSRGVTTDGTVLASGNIEITETRLGFKIAGRLAERLVEEGERVATGEVIARLEQTDQRLLVARADAELAQALARLAELEAGSRPEELQRAAANVAQRHYLLAELEHGSRSQEVSDARAELARAGAALRTAEAQARMARADRARYEGLLQRGVVSRRESELFATAQETADGAVTEAVARMRSAEDRLSLRQEGSRAEQIAQARAALSATQADMALAKAGPRQEVIQQARAQVEALQTARQQAAELLSNTELRAVAAGIVLSKAAEAGDYLQPGAAVISMGNLDQVWLRAYVSETDLARVKTGLPALVTIDSLPGKRFSGTVSFIASEAEFTPKTVQTPEERVKLVFRIKILLTNPEHALKPGMPADARIGAEVGAA